MIGKAISFACAMAAGANALHETQRLQMGALENNLAQADIHMDDMHMDLDENMFAQLLSQEGWGSTAPAQPSPYELIYKLFEQIKHLKYGQEYLMKKFYWLDHKSNQNMMELETLESKSNQNMMELKALESKSNQNMRELKALGSAVLPLKNVFGVNTVLLGEGDLLLKSVKVSHGQTIEILSDAAATFSNAPAKLQIIRNGVLVAESTADNSNSAGIRQPPEVAAVVYKETLKVDATFQVIIGNGEGYNSGEIGVEIAPYNAQVAYKIYNKGYTPVEFMSIPNDVQPNP